MESPKSVAKWTWSNYTGDGVVKRGRDQIKGAHLDDLRDKQALSAIITNKVRISATEQQIKFAVMRLKAANKKITIASVAKISGIHRNTAAKHKDLF